MDKDITQIKEVQQIFFENEEIYQLILEHSRDLIRVLDVHFNFIYVSPSHETVLGYTPNEMMHTFGLNILHPDDREIAVSMHQELVSKNVSMDGLFRFQCKNGQWITLETRGKSLVKEGEIVGVVTIGRDVTERLRMEQQLREYQDELEFLAFHDPLTRLPNRTQFFDRTTKAIEDAKSNDYGIAILLLDCDGFKSINDAYGHDFGDEVIKELGRRISMSIGKNDTVARLGGDEFTVLLPHINTPHDVVEVAHRILQSANTPWEMMGHQLDLSVSIGVTIYPTDGVDTQTLIKHADEAMYNAKKQKKNTYAIYCSRSE